MGNQLSYFIDFMKTLKEKPQNAYRIKYFDLWNDLEDDECPKEYLCLVNFLKKKTKKIISNIIKICMVSVQLSRIPDRCTEMHLNA